MSRKPPPKNSSPLDMAAHLASSLADAAEIFAPLREAVKGYRQSYLDEGWGQEAAEAMSVQYHMLLCDGLLNGDRDE